MPFLNELLLFFYYFSVDTLVIMGDEDNPEEHFMEKQINETSKNEEN